ncbi:MAG: adenosylcobinamide-GDP ribazoletransferase, partial [Thermoflexia bacterium]
MFRSLLTALHFLTRLPFPLRETSLEEVGRSAWAFPLVGALTGLLLAGSDWALGYLFPPLLRAAPVLALWVAITGALHLDGFVDCCDALLAARPPEVRLEILRDTHVGAFGVVGAVVFLLLK